MSSCAFQDCTSTWVLFAKYFKHTMLPHPQSVAKTGSTLPAFQGECQLRSSAFPNQTDNLSLRCFSRNSKNYSFSRLVPSLLHHGGRWSRVCLQIPEPNCNLEWFASFPHTMPSCAFQDCTSTWVLFAKYFKHILLPHPQSVAKTGSTLPAFQRECQLRSSAFPNQTDNLSLRCFSRKSKNKGILFPVRLALSLLRHGGRWLASCPHTMSSRAFQHCTSNHQHLSAFCQKYLKHIMLPHPQSVAKTGSTLPALQRESASWEAQPFPTKPTI